MAPQGALDNVLLHLSLLVCGAVILLIMSFEN